MSQGSTVAGAASASTAMGFSPSLTGAQARLRREPGVPGCGFTVKMTQFEKRLEKRRGIDSVLPGRMETGRVTRAGLVRPLLQPGCALSCPTVSDCATLGVEALLVAGPRTRAGWRWGSGPGGHSPELRGMPSHAGPHHCGCESRSTSSSRAASRSAKALGWPM